MSIVFTDSFTVGADVDIASYPATPDYAYSLGVAGDISVNAANDRVQVNADIDTDKAAYITNAAVPTTDQQCTVSFNTPSAGAGSPTVRNVAAGTPTADIHMDFYEVQVDPTADTITIYKVTNGGFQNVASGSRTVGTTGTLRLKATGTNPVALEAQVDATAVLTYDDSDVSRKQSGPPGFAIWDHTLNTIGLDDLSIDDLAGATATLVQSHYRWRNDDGALTA